MKYFHPKKYYNLIHSYILKLWWRMIPSSLSILLAYRIRNGQWLNLCKPTTFNEKMNWLKLHDHNPLYHTLADKYAVKQYVSQLIGDQYVIPLLGVWISYDEIDFDLLPDKFILKCTHDSGTYVICRDKSTFEKDKYKTLFLAAMKEDYFYAEGARQWSYKGIKPQIIAEKLLEVDDAEALQDCKFWCFYGEPKYMYYSVKTTNIYENFYDMNHQPINIDHGFPRRTPEFEVPVEFETMKCLATQLSQNIPFVRVDFFYVKDKVYFAEYTFYDWGGMRPFAPKDDLTLGKLI